MKGRLGSVVMVLAALALTDVHGAGPRLLAPGAISTEDHNEYGLALSPDGNTAYFTRDDDVYVSLRVAGKWTPATRAPFCSEAFDGDPFVTRDGKRLFFMSNRTGSLEGRTGSSEKLKADVWVTRRRADGSWGAPANLGSPVNSPSIEGHASLTSAGVLYYFSGRDGGVGRHDIYRSVPTAEGYTSAENLGPPVNTEASDGHPYVSPDEDYLLFYSYRPGGQGSCDLYISFREGRRWAPPQNLGPEINTAECEMTPHVAPDGSRLYFARIHEDKSRDLYVVDFSAARWRQRGAAGHPPEGNIATLGD